MIKITRKKTSILLHKFGVPGLRFLDRGSRTKQEGSHNFIIWDEDAIKLLDIDPSSNQDAIDYFNKIKTEQEQNNSFLSDKDIETYQQLMYHGSSHIILNNRFELKYVGTGEGTQYYGYGIYLAQNHDVADSYRHEGYRKGAVKGNVYTVDGPEDYQLLDLDAKIANQPAGRKFFIVKDKIFKELIRLGVPADAANSIYMDSLTGEDYYLNLAAVMYDYVNKDINSHRMASMMLNKFGIYGLRFFDKFSRDKGNGTSNFVIWNTDTLKIMGVEGDIDAVDYFNHVKQEQHNFNPDNESYFQIGAKRKNDMDNALAKSRPDLTQKQRAEAISEIEKLGETVRQGGYPKVEKLATHWLLHGHVILPEDNYKILDAIRICEQHHLDPMRFDDPNAILAQFTIKESNAEKRINPDSVPEFSNKVLYDNGITVYNVEDSRKGQAAVRNIIDTHWGEDANPWCLAKRDKDGTLDEAWGWWKHYDGVDKRIAFKDGKLLAFCADTEFNKWWDREDKSSKGIPYTIKENGNTIVYSYYEDRNESTKIKETLSDGSEYEYYENGEPKTAKLPDGTVRRYYPNGQLLSETLPDGTMHSWYPDEQIKTAKLPDGTTLWDKKGSQLQKEILPDGTEHEYRSNGVLAYENLPDGTMRYWHINGQLESEKLPDGTMRYWYDNGQLESEKLPDGNKRIWRENGQLKFEELPDGTIRQWLENGQIEKEELPDGKVNWWYINEQSEKVKLPAKEVTRWKNKYGNLKNYLNEYKRTHPDGFINADALEHFDQLHTHATGHIILDNKFDLRYVGTGEGGAMFGHGIYLEEDPEVAQTYRSYGLPNRGLGTIHIHSDDGFTYSSDSVFDLHTVWTRSDGKILDDSNIQIILNSYAHSLTAKNTPAHKNIQKSIRRMTKEDLNYYKKISSDEQNYDDVIDDLQNQLDFLNSLTGFEPLSIKKGNVYLVDIPDDYELLDWDKPLKNQPQDVLNKLRDTIDNLNNNPAGFVAKLFSLLARNPKSAEKSLLRIIQKLTSPEYKGQYLYERDFVALPEFKTVKRLIMPSKIDISVKDNIDNFISAINSLRRMQNNHALKSSATGGDLYHALTNLLGSKENASMYLNSLGIPGHRYFDRQSRMDKNGTHNFVIWNVNRLTILGLEGDEEAVNYFRDTALQKLTGNPDEHYEQSDNSNNNFISDEQIEHFNQLMWHGTRHSLTGNRFDLRFLSSGEGGQAYGYGIYLAEQPLVSQSYRKSGMRNIDFDDTIFIDSHGKETSSNDWAIQLFTAFDNLPRNIKNEANPFTLAGMLSDIAHNKNSDKYSSINEAVDYFIDSVILKTDMRKTKSPSEYVKSLILRDKDTLRNSIAPFIPDSIKAKTPSKGNLYSVEGSENFELLDWDAPMSQQSEQVLHALKRGGLYLNDDETGEQLYRRLQKQFGGGKNGERLAAMALNDAGIPGHRFFDEFSRKNKQGTHNFVIWNTDTLNVLGISDDSDFDAQEYFRAEDLYNAYLDALDNDSDVLDYSSNDYHNSLDDYANASLDALDNRPDYESYQQLIGQNGARQFDLRNGNHDLINALNTAIRMERELAPNWKIKQNSKKLSWSVNNENILKIWQATGWFRGVDGKWRYELPYGQLSNNFDNIRKSFSKNKNTRNSKAGQVIQGTKLNDVFDAPELFYAYPQLMNVFVNFEHINGGALAKFIPEKNLIVIDSNANNNLRSVLIHEIQHIIQNIEGFAKGGNQLTGFFINDNNAADSGNLNKNFFKAKFFELQAHSLFDALDDNTKSLFSSTYDNIKDLSRTKADKLIREAIPDNLRSLFDAWRMLLDKGRYYSKAAPLYLDNFDSYWNFAGEVEARNASSRSSMNDDERKHYPPSFTQSVRDDEQIILDNQHNTLNPENYNQLIGTKGAKRLDALEGNTVRMDGLRMAKELERQNISAKRIWLATGWNKGKDGQWRYEIPYGKLKDDFTNIQKKLHTEDIYLHDVLNAPMLFDAYPILRKTRITVIYYDRNASSAAYFDDDKNYIVINGAFLLDANEDKFRSALIHEIQHAIQFSEGFSNGGYPDSSIDTIVPSIFNILNSKDNKTNRLMRDALRALHKKDKDTFANIFDSLSDNDKKDMQKAMNLHLRYEKLMDDYKRIAGEVEARNAQTRSELSDLQRIAKSPDETEDTPREYQRVIFSKHNNFITPEIIEQFEQIAYHGTDNRIRGNRFNLRFAGSSEGSAAYAYGAYFAQNIDVAQTYRHFGDVHRGNLRVSIRTADDTFDSWGKGKWNHYPNPYSAQVLDDLYSLAEHTDNPNIDELKKAVLKSYRAELREHKHILALSKRNGETQDSIHLRQGYIDRTNKKIDFLKSVQSLSVLPPKNGNIYIFDIPENDEFLDWDKPIPKQPELVRQARKEILSELKYWGMNNYPELLNALKKAKTGGEFYKALVNVMEYTPDAYTPDIYRPDARASFVLNNFGIPGTFFIDSGSRDLNDKRKQTHNFVIWNTDTINMLGITDDSNPDDVAYFNELNNNQQKHDNESYNQISNNSDMPNDARPADSFLSPEGRKQIERVRRKYEGTEQWLKAPNGKKTKLTELQWLQVRTPNFKKWFGDWENHPENASKVLDENGEPLVLYHGTPNFGFFVFDTNGDGAWFTPDIDAAKGYSLSFSNADDRIYPVFLNIRNPYIHDALGAEWHSLADVTIRDEKNGYNIYVGDADNPIGNENDAWNYIEDYLLRDELGNLLDNEDENGNPLYSVKSNGLETTRDIVRAVWNGDLGNGNHDGVIIKDVVDPDYLMDDYIIPNNTQVKSATDNNGEFNTNDPDIYHQIIGEKGARKLDAANSNSVLINNLNVAKIMEARNFHPDKIWFATGWIRGVDGAWKYEIPDGKLKSENEVKHAFSSFIRHYLSPKVQKAILNNAYKPVFVHNPVKLKDIFDAPELYKAYPQLEKFTVDVAPLPDNLYAITNAITVLYPKLGAQIVLNINAFNNFNHDAMQKAMLHEIQHVIQLFEGFAFGNSMSVEAKAIFNDMLNLIRDYGGNFKYHLLAILQNLQDKNINASKKIAYSLPDDVRPIAAKLIRNFARFLDASEVYEFSAGEAEARNVVAREHLTPEQRRYTPPYKTSDVPQEKQIPTYLHVSDDYESDLLGKPESYNQIIGENGARNLDRADGTYTRMDNLLKAKIMRKNKISPKNIRLATGWEFAPDGKWRYEIQDSHINSKALFDAINTHGENLPFSMKLHELYDNKTLFNAYPQIKNMPVIFRQYISGYDDKTLGIYVHGKDKHIELKAISSIEKMRSVLIHEIQHAVQDIEGFAQGGYSSLSLIQGKQAVSIGKKFLHALLHTSTPNVRKAARLFMKGDTDKANNIADNMLPAEKGLWKRVLRTINDINHSQFRVDSYSYLGGEIEARNAETRADFSDEQRRNNTLESTQDNNDWLVVQDNKPQNFSVIQDFTQNSAPERYNQIIGEKGARAIDKANGNTNLMDNLNIAKQMMQAGKNKKTIRLATGWEMGSDNNWKYEIPDGNLRPNAKFNMIEKTINLLRYGKHKYISPEANLGDIFDAPELFKAYPKLKSLPVYASLNNWDELGAYSSGDIAHGMPPCIYIDKGFSDADGRILLFSSSPRFARFINKTQYNIRSILLHELQHAVQEIEGFAKGIHPEHLKKDFENSKDKRNKLKEKIKLRLAQIEDISGCNDFIAQKEEEYKAMGLEEGPEIWFKSADDEVYFWDNSPYGKEYRHLKAIFSMLVNDSPDEKYLRNPGEREARNTEIRQNFSDEQRRNTLISETEDDKGRFKDENGRFIDELDLDNLDYELGNESYYQTSNNTDNAYFDALLNDDLDSARTIVDEQARKKGYTSNPDDYRMPHRAPNRKYDFNLDNINHDDYFMPKDLWTHPELYFSLREELAAIRLLKRAADNHSNVTVYRAVLDSVKDSKLRNGDWVTTDRSYAVQHREQHLRAPYRIIQDNVPLKHLWWDGNSPLELGFDDGNNYAYRNTKNNRKLNDTVVRDDNGNIIPPSKRFNYRKPESYYQQNTFVSRYSFSDDDTEQQFTEAKRKSNPADNKKSLKHYLLDALHGLNGDFPELATKQAKQKDLTYAREVLRMLKRKSDAQIQMAVHSLNKSLDALNPEQFDIFTRMLLINDIYAFKRQNPNAPLPLGFTPDSLKAERIRFSKLIQNQHDILKAAQDEANLNSKIKDELASLARELGLSKLAEKVSSSEFNSAMLDYANILSPNHNDINANYIHAMGTFRAQQLQDILRLQAIRDIKAKYDIKDKLIRQFGSQWGLHIPNGYKSFNILAGHFIEAAHSLHENILAKALEATAQQLGLSDETIKHLRESISEKSGSQLLVLPIEIVDSIHDLLTPKQRGPISQFLRNITAAWKKHVLYFPTRVAKYNLRNLTGDLDAVIAGNPNALKFLKQAVSELYDAYLGNAKNITPELLEFQKRGGAITTETSQELYDYHKLKQFKHLIDAIDDKNSEAWKNLPQKAWDLIDKFAWSGVQNLTDFREAWLRYACYLSYLHQMQNNLEGEPDNWGASVPDEVMSIPDIRDRAFKMSNELLGAYDQVSQTGQSLRELFIPFYSWLEVNAKRYYQLLKNGFASDKPVDFMIRSLEGLSIKSPVYAYRIGKTLFMVNLLSMLVKAFNHFVWPDDEDKLPPDIKERPHITLGHDPVTGDVLYFDRIGAIADNLEWFRGDAFFSDIKTILDGKLSVTQWVKMLLAAPVNKIMQGINPIFKAPFELATGKSLYPDFTNPRNIQDRFKYIAQSLGLNWPFKIISGEPHSTWDEFRNLFVYGTDADEAAYFYTLNLVRQFSENVLGKRSGGFSYSQRGLALQNLKRALRLDDKQAINRYLQDYFRLNGNSKGLKTSLRNLNPLHSLSKREQAQFLNWISDDDRIYFDRANQFFRTLLQRFAER